MIRTKFDRFATFQHLHYLQASIVVEIYLLVFIGVIGCIMVCHYLGERKEKKNKEINAR